MTPMTPTDYLLDLITDVDGYADNPEGLVAVVEANIRNAMRPKVALLVLSRTIDDETVTREIEVPLPDGPYLVFTFDVLLDNDSQAIVSNSGDGMWVTPDDGREWSDLTIWMKPA